MKTMNKFSEVKPISRELASIYFASGEAKQICEALVSIAFYEKDWKWAQETFLNYLESSDPCVAGLSATCLGHLARANGILDKERVVEALSQHLKDWNIVGQVQDAMDDVEQFVASC